MTSDPEATAALISLREAKHIVKNGVIAAMAASWLPIPIADLLVLTGISTLTIRRMCEYYEIPFDRSIARGAVILLAAGVGPVAVTLALASLLKVIPGLYIILSGATGCIAAGVFTYGVGEVFIRHFEAGGTLSTFRAADHLALFRHTIKARNA